MYFASLGIVLAVLYGSSFVVPWVDIYTVYKKDSNLE